MDDSLHKSEFGHIDTTPMSTCPSDGRPCPYSCTGESVCAAPGGELEVPSDRPTQVERVRCYSCGHEYVTRPGRIDTACPACGSDSFTLIPPAEETRDA